MIRVPPFPSPLDEGSAVLRHDVVTEHRGQPIFLLDVQDVEPGALYVAEAWVFLPTAFAGESVGLVMIGFAAQSYVQPDLGTRDAWQRASVVVRIPDDQTRTFLALMTYAEPGSVFFSSGWRLRRDTPAVRRPVSRRANYKLISVRDLASRPDEPERAPPLVQSSPCLPDATVRIPPVSFGQVRRPEGDVTEWPPDAWDLAEYRIASADLFKLRNAVVHGEQGIVTVGEFLLAESLYMAQPSFAGFETNGHDSFSLEVRDAEIEVDDAAHLLCGYVGNRNYAHWWVDIVPALLIPPFHDAFAGAQLLFPQLRQPWQADTLRLLDETRGRSIFVGEHARVACRTLRFVPQITQSDLTPHPFRSVILEAIKRRAGHRGEQGRRVYVTRRDARARRLLNEEDVVTLVERHGFETVTLTGMKLAEQIKLFAAASHVIGAHGAGLGNVIFCPPGAALCEFQMMSNVQWSIRRLAAVTNMRYGCLMGAELDDAAPLALRDWSIDLGKLSSVLTSEEFG